MNEHNNEYNIVKTYDNGVRVGNIPSHKNPKKSEEIFDSQKSFKRITVAGPQGENHDNSWHLHILLIKETAVQDREKSRVMEKEYDRCDRLIKQRIIEKQISTTQIAAQPYLILLKYNL